jgi:hypothetical protein
VATPCAVKADLDALDLDAIRPHPETSSYPEGLALLLPVRRGQYASNLPVSCLPGRSDDLARIEPMTAGTLTPTEEAVRRRLIEFASDAAQLADQRPDLEPRLLIDGLHADLLQLREDHDE